jgi:hypothetical protein
MDNTSKPLGIENLHVGKHVGMTGETAEKYPKGLLWEIVAIEGRKVTLRASYMDPNTSMNRIMGNGPAPDYICATETIEL